MAETKHGTVRWLEEQNFSGRSGSGFEIKMGAGQAAEGASPMELLLLALGGCGAIDVVGMLEKMRQRLSDLEVYVEGVRRDEHPRVYTHIVVRYVITGHHLDPQAVARAVELSETKYCSVAGMLGTACDLTTIYEIREAADQAV